MLYPGFGFFCYVLVLKSFFFFRLRFYYFDNFIITTLIWISLLFVQFYYYTTFTYYIMNFSLSYNLSWTRLFERTRFVIAFCHPLLLVATKIYKKIYYPTSHCICLYYYPFDIFFFIWRYYQHEFLFDRNNSRTILILSNSLIVR